ncbi:hypothetical protein GCM10022403_088650 [Streptomyces coacervatus]|uniref:Uncharacterized protein n=1 Tax=Streptomyces coacervatus TaxID=647381 RepID=A0ABP7JFB3_9ACTN
MVKVEPRRRKVEPRRRRGAQAWVEHDAEAGERASQYGGFDAERDVGPPGDPAGAVGEVEGRRQRAMPVSPEASMHPRGPQPPDGSFTERSQ